MAYAPCSVLAVIHSLCACYSYSKNLMLHPTTIPPLTALSLLHSKYLLLYAPAPFLSHPVRDPRALKYLLTSPRATSHLREPRLRRRRVQLDPISVRTCEEDSGYGSGFGGEAQG
ncbi:hypothetical protein C8R44DRAFT_869339 [Mycena epipterygia]|nr:hypothetical protein C8R44DRAFT_869339 [Mycena epipterygia]